MLKKNLWKIFCIAAFAMPCFSQVKIIFDTDIGGDADDAGALATLHALADNGEAEILAVNVWGTQTHSVGAVDAINTYYGRPDIPIGKRPGGAWNPPSGDYNEKVAESIVHDQERSAAPDAADLYREILAAQPDSSVKIVAVGPLGNLQALLESPADAFSTLTGIELVRQKVSEFVIMGGKYPNGGWEWNFNGGIEGVTKYVVENAPVPIMFSGFEVGIGIKTGAGLSATIAENPVHVGYLEFNTNCPDWYKPCLGEINSSASYDQTAVLYAVRGLRDYWTAVTAGSNSIQVDGNNKWVDSVELDHSYLVRALPTAEMADTIEALMVQPSTSTDYVVPIINKSKKANRSLFLHKGNLFELRAGSGKFLFQIRALDGRLLYQTTSNRTVDASNVLPTAGAYLVSVSTPLESYQKSFNYLN